MGFSVIEKDKPTRVTAFTTVSPLHNSRLMNSMIALSEDGLDVTILGLGCRSETGAVVEINSCLRVKHFFLLTRPLPRFAPFLLIKLFELYLRALIYCLRGRSDVYVAFNLPALPIVWIASQVHSSCLAYDASELYFDRPFIRLPHVWRVLQSWLLKSTDLVYAANEARARIMYEEYGALTMPLVIHNYVAYRPIEEDSEVLGDFVRDNGRDWNYILLHQGNVVQNRAVESMIQALKFLPDDIGLVFLGAVVDDYQESLLNLAASEGVTPQVLFHPPVPLEVLPRYTASASLGLVFYLDTSRNNYYCAPTKLYAYVMAGIPVVGSDFPGLRADILGNRIGAVADPEDPQAIAEAISSIIDDPDDMSAMGERARQLAKGQWNWELEEVRLKEAYLSLMNSEGSVLVRDGRMNA